MGGSISYQAAKTKYICVVFAFIRTQPWNIILTYLGYAGMQPGIFLGQGSNKTF